MSVISELLSIISNATYGRDVRQAIIDAIQQCYNDATGNPESLASLVAQVDTIETTVNTLVVKGAELDDGLFGLQILDADTVETDTLEWILNHDTGLVSVSDGGQVGVTVSSGVATLDGVLGFSVSGDTVTWYQNGTETTEDTAISYMDDHSLVVYVTI